MKKVVILMAMALLSGCADSVSFNEAALQSPVGFLHGFWHGLILPFAWIASLFLDGTSIYAIYNNGGWYDFGFFIGIGGFASGASTARGNQ